MGQQRTLDAVVPRADDDDALPREIVVAAALEHDADARVAGRGQRRGHARERRDAEGEHGRPGLHLVARGRGQAHAAVGELDPADIARIALAHEAAPEPLGVAQEVRQRQGLDALAVAALHPGLERACAPGRRQVRVLPVGAQQHVGRHQPPPRAHGLAERAGGAVQGGVRGDREPEGAGADDCGVDSIHALNLGRSSSC